MEGKMIIERYRVWLTVAGLSSSAIFAMPAFAQSTNAAPDLTMNQSAVDPSTLTIPDDAKKALSDDLQQLKSGQLSGLALAVSASGKTWSLSTSDKSTPVYSIVDLARVALERCQYWYGAPCAILSINGHDTQLPGGGWAAQPNMLFKAPGVFDANTVPFIHTDDRAQLASYGSLAGNRALVLTADGAWLYRSADTIQKAIDQAENDCSTSNKGSTCILYAVNDRVVFEPY
jgi:hypothetical protein